MARTITLGIEEEFQLCDPETGDLTPAVDSLLAAAAPPLRGRLAYELLHTVLEGNIAVADDLDQAMERVRELRCSILELADAHGVAIGIGGVHPFARWQDQDFVDTPGYQWVGDQLQYLARRNLSFGLHVHVGIEDGDARVYVANQFRRWCAPLLALSANAPFFEGADTGFRTIRMHVFGSFPRTGFAPPFRSWRHYMRVLDRLTASGAITAPRQAWWNVRPHVTYGTVELRMLDMQIDLGRTRTFVALAQALTAGLLADYEAGVPEWDLEPAFLADGWFKAQRFGWEARVAHPASGETVTLLDEIRALEDAARPWAEELGIEDAAIEGLEQILASGPEADWQRARWRETRQDLGALQRRIFARVRQGARCGELVLRE
ncbi:MAG TPA: YbdK family carboxylate-amine ligase [Gemmatimonadota bacterium]|nr:YbdK family carboxylate-amine ligase [Gemmatimonadota bacterium]